MVVRPGAAAQERRGLAPGRGRGVRDRGGTLQGGPRHGARTGRARVGTADRHEPRGAVASAAAKWRGAVTPGAGLPAIHRRVRDCRADDREGAASYTALVAAHVLAAY